jgi:autotransporter-associated beta strand protein
MYHDKFPINDDHGRHMWFFLNRTTPGNPDGRRRRSAFFGSAFLYRLFLLAAVVMACGCALADSYWQGATSDFNVAASWNPAGVPAGVNAINDSGSNNVVLIRPGDPAWSPYDIRAGDAANASGSYLQTGSTNNVNGWFRLGDYTGAYGSYVLSNGVVNASLQSHVGEAGVGALTVSGGKFNAGQNPFCLGDGDFGPGGAGTLKVTGGTVTTALGVDLWLGEGYNGGVGGTGTLVVAGGTVNIGGWFAIGRFGGIGDLEFSSGSITLSPGDAGNITLSTAPSSGVVNQSGGALTNTVSQTWVAESAVGTWNLSGGADVLGLVLLTRLSGATGTFNLNGGDLFATQIQDTGGNGAFNFNGGILHARASSANFLQAVRGITVQAGGAIINSEGYDISINQSLANGGGGLTKIGAGSLTLSGDLLYSGPTVVSKGSLMISVARAFASPSCAVSNGAAFGVVLASAGAQVSVPTLTLPSGGGLSFDFAGAGGQPLAPLRVTTFTANGSVVVNVAGFNFSTGQFPLLQYGSRAGNAGFTLGSLPSGMAAQIVTNTANKSIDLLVTQASVGLPWQPKQAPLMTDWAQQVNPTNVLPEYPRPQMVRSNWMNLNGVWQFQTGATNDPVPTGLNLSSVILVPFPMESALSGIMQYAPFSWYRRQFTVPAGWAGQRILLHFEAVNWRSQIYVNGQSVGVHTGGYDPFTYDVTPYLTNSGPQELIVRVYSPVDSGGEPRGKQTLYPGGIMFTSASGIWQPVWLEPVPPSSIGAIRLVPDLDVGRLLVNATVSGPAAGLGVSAVAFDGTNQIASSLGAPGNNFYLNIPAPKLWSPTNPFLYDLKVSLVSNATTLDTVASYFGMRKISLGTNNGFVKIFLNNQFIFEFGPLDQGFWPDGVYTAPTDLALKSDLEAEKTLGFNMVRKHIKVEPQRWYYWADKLGILVWQDMPSCNSYTGNPSPPPVDPLDFIAELTAMVTNHWNSPAIIMWDIFNEGQGEAGSGNGVGQTNTPYLVSLVKTLDPSRLVNQASGWTYFGAGDVLDQHNYPDPMCPASANQAVVCGEFGGVWLGVSNHTWSPGSGEVSPAQAAVSVASQFESLAGELPDLIQSHGMSAAVYTEISDVEIELAGLRTYDRKLLKPDLHRMQVAITSPMAQYSYNSLVPTSQTSGQNWKYTTTTPASNWSASDFDDSTWTTGAGGFGTAGTPGIVVGTTWNTADIWLRRTFNPGALTAQQRSNLVFNVFHDEDCELYLNGVLAGSASSYVTGYGHVAMNAAGQNAVVANANNVLAVHCHQTTGGQGIDAGIDITVVAIPPPPIFTPNWLENGTGLAAEYFSDTNLANPVFARVDANINFNWGNNSPGGGVPNNPFSVRWTGRIQPRYTEGYTFHLTSNGGCRLWIDGQLIIDHWRADTNSDVTGSIALTGGQQYDLRAEYYHDVNPADAVLEWDSASQSRQIVPQGVLFPANKPPVLGAVSNAVIIAGQTLLLTNTATDADAPAQTLTWNLTASPPGASLDATSGLLTWRPTISQSPSTNVFTIVVTDNGTPALSATQNLSVIVLRPAAPIFFSPTFSGGKFQSLVGGDPGPDYLVYATTNLSSTWQLLLNTNPAALPFLFTDPNATNYQRRYYRVLLGP